MKQIGWKTAVLLTILLLGYCWLFVHVNYGPHDAAPVLSPATIEAPAPVADAPNDLTPPKSYECRHTDHLISITGRGSDPAWRLAPWTDFFVDIEGDKKPKPRFLTRAKMLWSDQFLYVYAELEEPDVWANITKKNAVIFHDNDFEVFMDPDGTTENYYEFEMNALNTIWELTLLKRYSRGGSAISPTNLPGLISAVHAEGTLNDPTDVDHGWSVEIAFPFTGLAAHRRNGPCPPNPGDRWRINFSRVEWMVNAIDGKYQKVPHKREDNWVWTPQGVIDMHQPEHWGYLDFTD